MENTENAALDQGQVSPLEQPRVPKPELPKKKIGDRRDGRWLRTLHAMNRLMPFVMRERSDSCNTYADEFDVTETDAFCKEMIRSGHTNFSFLHVMLAAYVRTVSQKPGINRYVSGRRIYAKKNIEVCMTIKKEMKSTSPDTCIKVIFEPDDTIEEVYEKFNKVVDANKQSKELDNGFDNMVNTLVNLPRPILNFLVKLLFWLDYHDWLPKGFLDISPFHGSMIITSMGSLGIRPIYHHIYNFGNLPVFFAYGIKRRKTHYNSEGKPFTRKFIEVKAVTDERICDGFYYASAFKMMRQFVENPRLLTVRPEQVFKDVD